MIGRWPCWPRCLTIGLAPQGLPLVFDRGVNAWAPEISAQLPPLAEVAPLSSMGAIAVALVVAILVGSIALGIWLRAPAVTATTTWGCAYIQPSRGCNIHLRRSPRCSFTTCQGLLPITNAPHQCALSIISVFQ
jgi:hypothetical protein